jgi:hypothetical protein
MSPGFDFKRIDSKESIPAAYVAWQAGTTPLFLLGSFLAPIDCSKIHHRHTGNSLKIGRQGCSATWFKVTASVARHRHRGQ